MVVSEPETTSYLVGEAESAERNQKNSNNINNSTTLLSSLGRQSSIYSLTLDEFQHTLCESGKNFGSMNMDEFLTSIWTAEENQQQANGAATNAYVNGDHHHQLAAPIEAAAAAAAERGGLIARQQSLTRQGSLTLPAPLCRKTVDEVWSEIHNKGEVEESHQRRDRGHGAGDSGSGSGSGSGNNNIGHSARGNSEITPRQPTFGEMTLEDFLVKAGVVREQEPVGASAAPQPYGMYPAVGAAGPGFATRPMANTVPAAYQAGAGFGDSGVYAGNGTRNGAYPPASVPVPVPVPPPTAGGYGGRVVNGGGYGSGQALGMAAPVSPVSPDGMCGNQVDNSGGQFGLDMAALRGRKRIIDGPVEKVVERRQRRMIKNRESAARSRARKQAYTVELEAELNQLREENSHLKQALADLERKQKQQYFEEMKTKVQTKAFKAKEKMRIFRRTLSCPL